MRNKTEALSVELAPVARGSRYVGSRRNPTLLSLLYHDCPSSHLAEIAVAPSSPMCNERCTIREDEEGMEGRTRETLGVKQRVRSNPFINKFPRDDARGEGEVEGSEFADKYLFSLGAIMERTLDFAEKWQE